jgi:serine-type D-Ala-D-Ala carboxypeptidase (penicillin-binding protein 5/6)
MIIKVDLNRLRRLNMRKKITRKKYMLLLTIITCGIIVLPYLSGHATAFQERIISSNLSTSNQKASSNENSSLKESTSYFMFNTRTGEKLLAENEQVQRPPASTVKLLTGIVAMNKLHEKDIIQVSEEVRSIEGSQIGLQPGDKISVKDLLTALYLESANDAAIALAVAAYGNIDSFIAEMNEYAAKIGCTNSQFKTPNGLPHPDQYTTAYDLAQIAQEFIQREDLMRYVSLKEANVEWTRSNGTKQRKVTKNTNQLLGIYPGDIGLKTGTTTEAGECLVTYVTREDGDILLVLLGSTQRYVDTIELLDQGISRIRSRAALKNITSHPDAIIKAPGFFAP